MLRRAIAGQRGVITAGSLLVVTHQLCEAAVPLLIGVIVDEAIGPADGDAMLLWTAVLVGLFVVLSAAGSSGTWFFDRSILGAEHELRMRVVERVLDPRGGMADAGTPGELVSLAGADAERVGMISAAVMMASGAIVVTVAIGVLLLVTSLMLGLVVVLGLPLVLWVAHAVSNPLEARSGAEQRAVARAAGMAADLTSGLRVVKGLGAERAAADRYRAASREALGASLAAARMQGGYNAATITLSGLFLVLVAWLGAREAIDGDISIGELIAAVGLTQFLVGPLQRLSAVGGWIAQARASAQRVADVIELAPAIADDGAPLTAPTTGGVRLEDVHHGTLRGVDLDVAPGRLVGIVAPPADAAALLRCLGREADPDAGAVHLGDAALPQIALADARATLLVAEHEAVLFTGTLAENVGVRDPLPALQAAAATDLVDALPEGTQTPMAERGATLSGGQRQRIALARALAADPPVLVLHDPTTAVDAVTEARIADGLRAVRRGRTTIVLTSSPALLAAADEVVVLRDGTVAGRGTHEQLCASSAEYREAVLS